MAAGAAEMMFRCVYEGSITMQDSLIERGPYHRNCDCALHKLKGACSSACSRTTNISFPKKQTWSDLSLSFSASKLSSQSSQSSHLPDGSLTKSRENVRLCVQHTLASQDDQNMSEAQYS